MYYLVHDYKSTNRKFNNLKTEKIEKWQKIYDSTTTVLGK